MNFFLVCKEVGMSIRRAGGEVSGQARPAAAGGTKLVNSAPPLLSIMARHEARVEHAPRTCVAGSPGLFKIQCASGGMIQ